MGKNASRAKVNLVCIGYDTVAGLVYWQQNGFAIWKTLIPCGWLLLIIIIK